MKQVSADSELQCVGGVGVGGVCVWCVCCVGVWSE